uniref:Secreted protein n=1 Tax=Ascaris lumbricoides TaxID=6252 RepID=A0A0M3IL41_ASCLU
MIFRTPGRCLHLLVGCLHSFPVSCVEKKSEFNSYNVVKTLLDQMKCYLYYSHAVRFSNT